MSISDFLSPSEYNAGNNILSNGRIVITGRETKNDSGTRVKAKSYDSFNFVDHPWLDITEAELVNWGCDCTKAKAGKKVCDHIAALILLYDNKAPEGNAYSDGVCDIHDNSVSHLDNIDEIASPKNVDVVADDHSTASNQTDFDEDNAATVVQVIKSDGGQSAESKKSPIDYEPNEDETHRSMEILLGYNLADQSPVFWYPNDTEKVLHTNLATIGMMGTGKTQSVKSIVYQLVANRHDNYDGYPLGVLIFDYKGDYNETKTDFVEATHATVLKPYKLPINPLALNIPRAFKPLIPVHTANEFKDTVARIYKDMGAKQKQRLFECVITAYINAGIFPDNPDTWTKPAPTFEQVYQIFINDYSDNSFDTLSSAMSQLHQFCLFEPDPKKAKPLSDLLNGVLVIDLSGYEESIQHLIVAITLDQFYSQMLTFGSSFTDGKYRQLRNLILVDEADNFMSRGFPSLKKIMKEGREFGVGMILSTQSLSHFIGGEDDYSRYVLTWIVHGLNDLKSKDIEYIFKLQPKDIAVQQYYGVIKSLKKHESVVKVSNDDLISIRDKAFWEIYEVIHSGSQT